MELGKFIDFKDEIFQKPFLYIIKQQATNNPNVHRCGLSGRQQFPNSDLPYRADSAILNGMLGRAVLYKNYWAPIKGTLYAALRIKAAQVATTDQRTGEDSEGNAYGINRANQTLIEVRERQFHEELTRRGLRYDPATKNELFRGNREQLEAALRTIKGEELYLFTETGWFEDPRYRGGSRNERITITETAPRQQPQRESRAPSLTITLSRSALEQLRSGSPQQFERLLNLVRSFDEERQRTTTVRAPKEVVQEMRQQTDAGRQILDAVVAQRPTRRSPRIAELNDRSTEATIEAPRRSARLARN
jgi:hypothetical protein